MLRLSLCNEAEDVTSILEAAGSQQLTVICTKEGAL